MHAINSENRLAFTPEEFIQLGGPKTVYVKQMAPYEIETIEGLPDEAKGPDAAKLYAVHLMDGTRVAVVDSREAAFVAARQYEMEPVSVH